MRKKQKTQLIMIAILLAVLLIIAGIVIVVIKLISGSKLESLYISPNFAEQELNINSNYEFAIIADPSDAKLKNLEYYVEGAGTAFEAGAENTAILYTGGEGVVTVCVMLDDVESNYLSFNVTDLVAREAEKAAAAQAEVEAAAAAELEAQAEMQEMEEMEAVESAPTQYVLVVNDKVNIRNSASTDGEKLGQAAQGASYAFKEEVDGWYKFDYDGQEGYIRNDMGKIVSEGDLETAKSELKPKEEEKKEEKKEETQQEESKPENTEAVDAAKAAEDAAKAAAEAAAKATEELIQQQQAAAAAAAAMGTVIHCTDGSCIVTSAQLQTIHATWDFAGDAVEMAGHHSIGELEAVVGPVTRQ